MKFNFADAALPKAGTLAILVAADRRLGALGQELDRITGGAVGRAMETARFSGKAEETLSLLAPGGTELDRVLLVGIGKPEQVDEQALAAAGGIAYAALARGPAEASILVELPEGAPAVDHPAAQVAFGANLRCYRFDKYRTKEKAETKPTLRRITLLTRDAGGAKKAWPLLDAVADGVFLTRDLVSEPANVLTPVAFAEACEQLAELGVEVDVLDEKRMRKLGMGALLGVAQGSENPPRLVTMQWRNAADRDARPLALIGKGVTFDTGGISIKPAAGMEDMKWDMAGAGAVVGTMRALAGRKARANVVGVVALVENMPSGTAQRPGDIVRSLSGQTIEVLNTDAEGRLVLADALWYAQDTFNPRAMIDLATLTGAILVALGAEQAGLFANDDALAQQLIEAGSRTGEKLWRMPLGDAYDKMINSDAADMKNIGDGRNAGSIVGAQFLKRFVRDIPWAHLDVAGVVWSKKDAPTVPKGGTGYGVRLLDRLVADHYEG
ncbi:leucyl aminopeptidase [Arenibaculum pallidiluteum]|uniref:leucyl aminopeptidase n=1 Tax=Arenibaculum pallidiluteum TaxID=2812559 RepID=UPI001A95B99D|nr:leucyl aminopeptidase [Arenibaculum pallidiluteum]